MALPRDFVFGVATASYQIEGAVREGGRTPSIWDTFAHTPGKVTGGHTGDEAVDHFHRWREDLDLMEELGIDSYRLSLSWSRLMDGAAVNPQGVAFYRQLLEELRARGIAPTVTLYHWDLPQYLEDAGGWPARATAYAFEHYARSVAREFSGLVDTWVTLNEPWCAAFLGYAAGIHAPGRTEPAAALQAAHHLNLAHGLAARAIREEDPGARVGIALNIHVVRPADPASAPHLEAVARVERVGNHIFLGPLLEGAYPSELIAETRHLTDWAFAHAGDLQISRAPLDVLGVNYYYTQVVRPAVGAAGESGLVGGVPASADGTPFVGTGDIEFLEPQGPLTEMGWNIDPGGLVDLLTSLERVYPGLEIAVMENGAAFPDPVGPDGTVHDQDRISYLAGHLAAVEEAIARGVNVRGYFLWSFIDNFEWAWGYTKRFGIVRAGPQEQERIPKASFWFYRDYIARAKAAGLAAGEAEQERAAGERAGGSGGILPAGSPPPKRRGAGDLDRTAAPGASRPAWWQFWRK